MRMFVEWKVPQETWSPDGWKGSGKPYALMGEAIYVAETIAKQNTGLIVRVRDKSQVDRHINMALFRDGRRVS